jgi:chromosome segregation ATPase
MVEIREVRNLTKRNLDREAEIARLRNEEIRLREELKVREMRIREEIMLRDEEMMHRARTNEARERLETSMRRLHLLREKAARLEHGQAVYQEKLDRSRGEDHESLEKLLDMQRQAAAAEREIAEVQEEMRAMENECATSQHLIAELQRTTESGSRGFFSPSPHNT